VTGLLKWSYQTRPNDVYGRLYMDTSNDRDVNTHPNIFEVVARRPVDSFPRIYRLVGVGSKDGNYRIFETIQDNNAAPELLASINVDVGGTIGGFQGTPAVHAGMLYTSTHGSLLPNGTRTAPNTTTNQISCKVTAYDIEALLEGRNFVRWSVVETPNFLGYVFSSPVYSVGIVFTTTFAGLLRGYSSDNGTLLFTRVDPVGSLPFGPITLPNPHHGGPTIVDGKILVGAGSSFFTNNRGGVVCYGFPYKRPQNYNIVVPPPGSPGCTLGYMRCSAQGFQTCTYTGVGLATDFGPVQSCAPQTKCVPNGNYIYCGSV